MIRVFETRITNQGISANLFCATENFDVAKFAFERAKSALGSSMVVVQTDSNTPDNIVIGWGVCGSDKK